MALNVPAQTHAGHPLPRYEFGTRHLPRSQQFAAWREMAAPLVALDEPASAAAGYPALQTNWDLGSMALTRNALPGSAFARTVRHVKADALDHWSFVCVIRGTLHLADRSGRSATVTPGLVHLQSLGRPGIGRCPDAELLHVFVPRDFCRDAVAGLEEAEDTTLGTGLGRLLADYLLALERQLPTLTLAELPEVLTATRLMIAACVRPSPDRLAEAQRPIDVTLLERARLLIQRNLLSPALSPVVLCRELGVSRSRLYRLFRPLGGVASYIRSRRLLDAHAALANPEDGRPIADIATERGFLDPAEFSRAFRRQFGYRPTDARQAVMPMQPQRPPGAGGSRALHDMVRCLR